MIYFSHKDEAALRARQAEIAAREGLLSNDTETPLGVRLRGILPSLCENETYGWDRGVVKALRELDPLLVPVGVKYLFRTNAGADFSVYRHALARMLPSTPEGQHADPLMNVVIPASPASVNVRARHPMIWLHILEGAPLPGLPGVGAYQPFDWRLFYNSREETRTPAEEARDRIRAEAEYKAKADKAARSIHDDSWDEQFPRIDHFTKRMSVDDVKALGAPIEPEKKSFVHVRGA